MTKSFIHSVAVCLLMLFPLCANAQRWDEEQVFHRMSSSDSLTFSPDNRTGTTEFVTYSCSGTGAEFRLYSSFVSIFLPKNGSTVSTTKIADLVGLKINHTPVSKCTNIKVYVSLDNTRWFLVSEEDTYKSGMIDIPVIAHDSYYVKITNTANSDFAIRSITYYMEKCNCFRYVPE